MRSRVLLVSIAVAAALVLGLPALASATNQITWDKKGHLTRFGPFKKLAKRDVTLGDFKKTFGAPRKKVSDRGGWVCLVYWPADSGLGGKFGRAAKSRHACVNSSIFTAIAISGSNLADWSVGGRVVPACTTLDAFKLLFPQSTLNYQYPSGSAVPDEEAWTISPSYVYTDPIYHDHPKPNPVSDVVARFYWLTEGSDRQKRCPLAPVDTLVLTDLWVVKQTDWLN